MITRIQIGLMKLAVKRVGLTDPQYRLLLRNVANVASSTELSQAGFEDVMSVLEDSGFRDTKGETYWREKVRLRGTFCNPRMQNLIVSLAAHQKYALPGLCERLSQGRVNRVDRLTPLEGFKLIEALKSITKRGEPYGAEAQNDLNAPESVPGNGTALASSPVPAGQPGQQEEPAAAVGEEPRTPTHSEAAAPPTKRDPWGEQWFPSDARKRRR